VESTLGSDCHEEADMYWHNGWDWLWMTFVMGFWLVVLGVVIYLAVRFALGDHDRTRRP